MNKVRQKAWQTRRAKYGDKGHGGSYSRSTDDKQRADRMEGFIIGLHNQEVLTEGQAVKATGLDRITLRIKADTLREQKEGTKCPD